MKYKKFTKTIITTLLVLCLGLIPYTTVFAEDYYVDPFTVEANYVEELVELSSEEINALPETEARRLFEESFLISSKAYSEDEIKLTLDRLAFIYNFENLLAVLSQIEKAAAAPNSTTGDITYTGDIGVTWVRDVSDSGSPLTFGEILKGIYTLEVDYLSWSTVATILAASSDYDVFQDLVEQLSIGATGSALSATICAALELSSIPATITSVVVGAVVGVGWNWLKQIERSNMQSCFNQMRPDQYMQVKFIYTINHIVRSYSVYTPSSGKFANPFPGTHGEWHTDKYGYFYTY